MLSLRIALRYLLSKKSHGAVNIISGISVAGVAVATSAIVIVLSVFNGFTQLAATRLTAIDPDLHISWADGKAMAQGDSLSRLAAALPGIRYAAPVIVERALARSGSIQMPIIFKGVPDSYPDSANMQAAIIDGEFMCDYYGSPAISLSAGVAIQLGARPMSLSPIEIFVPRRVGRINPANPATAFRSSQLTTTSVFQTDQAEYDTDYALLPLDISRELLQYDNSEATAIEAYLAEGADQAAAKAQLQSIFGDKATIKTRAQLEEKSFKMIMVEKWITFLMLAFILVIAAFNILSTLALLVLEKKDNMQTLRYLGATAGMVRSIFMWQGLLISMIGGVAGLALGSILTLAQQWGHFIKLGGDPTQLSITSYPVQLQAGDLAAVFVLILAVAALSAVAANLISRKNK